MLTVRHAEPRDIPAILNLLVQVDMVHHNGRPDLFKGPATKYNAAELEKILADDETPVFVCVDDGDRVLGHGFCIMQHSGGQLLVEHTTVYIDDICVDEAARGRGAGPSGAATPVPWLSMKSWASFPTKWEWKKSCKH